MYFCILICLLASVSVNALGSSWEWVSFTESEYPSSASVEVIEQDENNALVEMNLKGMYTQKCREDGRNFHYLSIPESDWMQESGKPKLPIVRALLKIPSNTNVDIQVEDDSHIRLRGYIPYPAGKKVVKRSHGEFAYVDEEFAFDHDLYSGNVVYPQKIAHVSFLGHLRQQRLAQLEFYPIRYDPRSAELICHYSIQVRLSYTGKSGSRTEIYYPESILESGHLGMPDQMMAPSASLQRGHVEYPDNLRARCIADYVIIAPEQFCMHDKVRELAEWRAQYSGLDVAVVSTSRIYDEFGGGTAEECIRSFIQYAYNSWRADHMPDAHIGYAILIGDVEYIPAHLSEGMIGISTITDIATDNWYACVSGDDSIPDVMLGRLPIKNIEELSSLIDKIIKYEKEPLYGDWANSALLAMGTIESFQDDMEHVRDEYLLPAGYSVSELSVFNGDGPNDIALAINEGQHIVDYAGHGWRNGWEIFRTLDMPMLKNGRKSPVIFSVSCETAHFDYPDDDCFGEKILKAQNGAIAFFGSSRITSANIQFSLAEAVAGLNMYTLGEITMYAKLNLLSYTTGLDLYNLLGDPALDLGAPRRLPGKVDMAVTNADIIIEPENPIQGQSVDIIVTINNLGTAEADNVTLEVRNETHGGALVEEHSIPAVPAGGKNVVSITWDTPLIEPQQLLSVKLYPEDNSIEYYTENNDAQKLISVSLEAEGWPIEAEQSMLSAPIIADLDGDGDMELLVQSIGQSEGNKVYVWHHDGHHASGWPVTVSPYAPARSLPPPGKPGGMRPPGMPVDGKLYNDSQYFNSSAGPSPAVGDLDGDGCPEVVAVFLDNKIHAWRNDGSELPGWPVNVDGYATSSPVLADIDSDSALEVAFGTSDGKLHLVEGHDGSSLPYWPMSLGNNGHVFPVVVDLDGDGRMEIVALQYPFSSSDVSKIHAWHLNGMEVYGWPVQMRGVDAAIPPVAGDLDGNGTQEIVAVSTEGDSSMVYVWDHSGQIAPGWPIQVDEQINSAIALGDLDMDGDIEIVACSNEISAYAWHHDGRSVFGWPVCTGMQNGKNSAPMLGDLDGDGQAEVAFISRGGIAHAYRFDGRPLRGWLAVTQRGSSYNQSPPAIADMDGDGKTEMAFVSGSGILHLFSLIGSDHIQDEMGWSMFLRDPTHNALCSPGVILLKPPTNIEVYDLPEDKGGSIVISWELSEDDEMAAGYVIYRSETRDGQFFRIGEAPGGVSEYIDDTVEFGREYWYVVRTSDGRYLSSNLSPISAHSINNFAPQPPHSVQASKGSIDCTIDVWWSMGNEDDLSGYKVYIGIASGMYGIPIDAGMTDHYLLTGLTNNIPYYISVTAYDLEGNESPYSSQATATPMDDDVQPPSFSSFYPAKMPEGTGFYIRCRISDPSGIYRGSSESDEQMPHVMWDNDGELLVDSHIVRMNQLSSGVYITDERIPGQSMDTQFVYQVCAYDDDFDWGNAADRSSGISQEHTVEISSTLNRSCVYPNPAPAGSYTDRTVFHYYVDLDAEVEIDIYDVTGRSVDSLKAEARSGAANETEWNISRIASGVYFYVIKTAVASGNKHITNGKLVIIK